MTSDLPAATRPEPHGRGSGVKECPSRGRRTKINKRPDLDAVVVSFDLAPDIFSRTAASVNPNRNYYDAAARSACGNSAGQTIHTYLSPHPVFFSSLLPPSHSISLSFSRFPRFDHYYNVYFSPRRELRRNIYTSV